MTALALVRPVPPPPDLRPYQERGVELVRVQLRSGRRAVCLICPTGGGKTIIAAFIITGAVARLRRVVVIAHRKELVDQTVRKLALFGVQAGVVMGDDARYDDYLPVQVCSIQTLARRLHRLPPADLVVYDECHHATSESSQKVLAAYSGAVLLGLTATPWRLDKRGLAEIFESSVLVATPAELMELGALVGYEVFAYDSPELRDVGMVAGEFNQKDLARACNTNVLVGSTVQEYLAHARGRRALAFPVDIAHSRHLVTEFRLAGVRAEHLDCDTPGQQREAILGNLARGSVEVVSSVGVLTEGFDCPEAEVCLLCRPTKSPSLYLQMVGRVLRPSPETGKQRALIHDHAGNLFRHGFPDDERDYSLTATPQRTRDLYTCPLCLTVFGQVRPDGTCPSCGEKIAPTRQPAPSSGSPAGKKTVDGRRVGKEEIQRIRAMLEDAGRREKLTDKQLARVATATDLEKAAEYKRLRQVAAVKGRLPGWVYHEFKRTFGARPKFAEEQLDNIVAADRPFLAPIPRAQR